MTRPSTAVAEPAPGTVTRPSGWALLRRLALRVHFFAGVLTAPFLAVLCVTGAAYVFMPQISNAVYAHEFFVDGQSGPSRPLGDQVRAALGANTGAKLLSVTTPAAADRTTAVVLSVPGLESGEARTVYVDPYTAEIRGTLTTVSGRPPAQQWLRELHGDLHLGTPGRLYSELAASWLPVLVLGGLVLWLGKRRRRDREPARPARGRARLRNRHAALGLWLAAGLLVISATGLTWSHYAGDRFQSLVTALDGRTPSLAPVKVSTPPPGGSPIGLDEVVAAGRGSGLDGPLAATPPGKPGGAYTVKETFQTLPVRSDSVSVDPYTGEVLTQLHFADYPLMAKLTTLGILLHSGTLLGLANQIGMALLALITCTMIVLGYRMWWKRRPSGATSLAPPPARPIWAALSQPVVMAAVVAVAAVSWALPVLGASLALFLVAELGLPLVRRRAAERR